MVPRNLLVNDIIMWRRDVELHMGHLREVLQKLDSKGLRVPSRKCVFGTDSIDFLGYRLRSEGLNPQLEEMRVIMEMPTPNDFSYLRAVLGLFSY